MDVRCRFASAALWSRVMEPKKSEWQDHLPDASFLHPRPEPARSVSHPHRRERLSCRGHLCMVLSDCVQLWIWLKGICMVGYMYILIECWVRLLGFTLTPWSIVFFSYTPPKSQAANLEMTNPQRFADPNPFPLT